MMTFISLHSDHRTAEEYITKDAYMYIVLLPLNPTFIQKNWVLQGYTLIFLFLLKNIVCGYSLEPPCRGDSNELPQSII